MVLALRQGGAGGRRVRRADRRDLPRLVRHRRHGHRFFFATGSNNERLEDITNAFPFWFTSRFSGFRNQATRLPFDQHSLAALVAPRLLLTTNGTDGSDIRTNPQGTSLTYRAVRTVYEYLGVPDRIGIAYRPGGHQIDMNDYNAIMDFSDKYLKGLPVSRTFNNVPYPTSAAAIPWTLPPNNGSPTPPTPATPTAPTTATPVTPIPTSTTGPTATPGSGAGCHVTYVLNQWSNGFTAELTIRNGGTSPINGWALAWSFSGNRQITNAWNSATTQSGSGVTARNASWNATIPAGGTTSFGFQATYSGTNARPASFTRNGAACSAS